ncbi:MAG: DUF3592 domain-containing protein [Anaerolineales bacterium]|nr:DUF3592 domain-containing protein [Anaerolineales bacterium]
MGPSLIIFGVVMVLLGAGVFFPARKARMLDQAREAWPQVPGTVTSLEVVPQPPLKIRSGKEIIQYDISINYQFRTGGQLHFGSAVSLPRHLYSKDEADRIAARYPAGGAVTVRHHPENVRECYLEIEKTAKNYRASIAWMVFGGLLALFGLLWGAG